MTIEVRRPLDEGAVPRSSPLALRFENVHQSLRAGGEEVRILRGVTFHVAAGELVALVGPSGSGKSTILGIAAGLDAPTAGRVVIDGIDVTGMPERPLSRLRSRRVGMVFQAYNLLPTLTALENVELPLLVPGQPPRPPLRRAPRPGLGAPRPAGPESSDTRRGARAP